MITQKSLDKWRKTSSEIKEVARLLIKKNPFYRDSDIHVQGVAFHSDDMLIATFSCGCVGGLYHTLTIDEVIQEAGK